MSLRGRSSSFYAFRNAIALYFVAQLCISASPFTIKLAAALWFLLGALSLATESVAKRRAETQRAQALAHRSDHYWTRGPSKSVPQPSYASPLATN